jgi:hypothetical protein
MRKAKGTRVYDTYHSVNQIERFDPGESLVDGMKIGAELHLSWMGLMMPFRSSITT